MRFPMSAYEKIRMPDTITAGKILMREGTELPGAMRLESEPYEAGWRLVKNLDGYGLGRTIHEAGWTFFCQAGDIKAATLGINEQRMVRLAVKRILAKVESEKFNSLEITRVATQRFLGVPYASVSARSRHIQESVFLFEAKDRSK
jgi:hypothetical protein